MPQAVAALFDKLIKTAIQEKRRSRDHVAALLTDDGNSEHAAVKRWVEARSFFVDWTHLDDEQVEQSELPTDDEIRELGRSEGLRLTAGSPQIVRKKSSRLRAHQITPNESARAFAQVRRHFTSRSMMTNSALTSAAMFHDYS